MTKYEVYTKFEDFARQVGLDKGIREVYFAPLQRTDVELPPDAKKAPEAQAARTKKVLRVIGSIKLTAANEPEKDNPKQQRHLSYTEQVLDAPVDSQEAAKAAGEQMQTGIKSIIERLQDKCPKQMLYEGLVEIR